MVETSARLTLKNIEQSPQRYRVEVPSDPHHMSTRCDDLEGALCLRHSRLRRPLYLDE